MKSGNLNFLEPSGPLQACNGTDLPLHLVGSNQHNSTICLVDTDISHAVSSHFTRVTKLDGLHILEKRGLQMIINGLSRNGTRICCVMKRVRCSTYSSTNRKHAEFITELF